MPSKVTIKSADEKKITVLVELDGHEPASHDAIHIFRADVEEDEYGDFEGGLQENNRDKLASWEYTFNVTTDAKRWAKEKFPQKGIKICARYYSQSYDLVAASEPFDAPVPVSPLDRYWRACRDAYVKDPNGDFAPVQEAINALFFAMTDDPKALGSVRYRLPAHSADVNLQHIPDRQWRRVRRLSISEAIRPIRWKGTLLSTCCA